MRVSPLREKHSPNSCDVHILKALQIPVGGSHISRSSGAVLENLCFWCGRSIALCERRVYVAAYNLSPQLSDVSLGSRSGHLHVSPTTAVT
ncbi:hypothetical protein G5I_02546 [Acromyrmex echinatior]|uniref:Uncharacterized protein n=1 Tax=Acromyrmex echinatior TaxID=103372 RepID=F4WAK8_ACREC|nr:hypothetical protein G5I_02546 [Acromyrmex echinatior]